VELLLSTNKVDVDARDDFGQTPLMLATQAGYKGVMELLLSTDKVDVDARSSSGGTPLIWTTKNGHETTVGLLRSKLQHSHEADF
jgi:ankyrin repeat protein